MGLQASYTKPAFTASRYIHGSTSGTVHQHMQQAQLLEGGGMCVGWAKGSQDLEFLRALVVGDAESPGS